MRRTLLASGLALGLFVVSLGACSSDHRQPSEVIRDGMFATREAVREVVPEPERQEELVALVDELERLLGEQSEDLQEAARRMEALNDDPRTTRAAFDAEFRAVTERRRARRDEVFDLHFRLIELTTEDEWKHIGKREAAAFEVMHDLEEE